MFCLPYDLYKLYKSHCSSLKLKSTNIFLKYYDGPVAHPKSMMSASVCIGKVSHTFNFVIVEGATRALLGRDIWAKFGL